MAITLLELLLQGIPEVIAATTLCFVLAGAGLRWAWILPIGTAQAVTIFLLRLLPLPFGVHTLVACVLFAVYLRFLQGIPVLRGFFSAFMALVAVIVLEYPLHVFLFAVTGLSYEKAAANPLLWSLFGWPQVVLVFVSALVIHRLREARRRPQRGGGAV
ncbi:MAG: hypothetical protein AB1776_05010 [Bacillota bacterium]